jgi:predicted nicotinamide N-methyase
MTRNSIYRKTFSRKERLLNQGYDYKDNILKNTMSSQMFEVNETFDMYIKGLNDVMYENIEAVKQIKVFANIALDKYETKIK